MLSVGCFHPDIFSIPQYLTFQKRKVLTLHVLLRRNTQYCLTDEGIFFHVVTSIFAVISIFSAKSF